MSKYKSIGKIDYTQHISRSSTLKIGLWNIVDGLIILCSFGYLGSSFVLKSSIKSCYKEIDKHKKEKKKTDEKIDLSKQEISELNASQEDTGSAPRFY